MKKRKNPGGRPRGPLMPCGWGCGANLTAVEIRDHFSHCPSRPDRQSTSAPKGRPRPVGKFLAETDSRTREFFENLRKGITRQRKEMNAQREKRTWNSSEIVPLELFKLLNWIETELDSFCQKGAAAVEIEITREKPAASVRVRTIELKSTLNEQAAKMAGVCQDLTAGKISLAEAKVALKELNARDPNIHAELTTAVRSGQLSPDLARELRDSDWFEITGIDQQPKEETAYRTIELELPAKGSEN